MGRVFFVCFVKNVKFVKNVVLVFVVNFVVKFVNLVISVNIFLTPVSVYIKT